LGLEVVGWAFGLLKWVEHEVRVENLVRLVSVGLVLLTQRDVFFQFMDLQVFNLASGHVEAGVSLLMGQIVDELAENLRLVEVVVSSQTELILAGCVVGKRFEKLCAILVELMHLRIISDANALES
jgi:hypothetical protein